MGVPASKLDLKPTQRRLLVPISTLLFLLVGGAASILYWEIDINSSLTNEDLLSSMLLEITEGLQEQADLLQKLGGNLSSQDRIGDLLVN
ncbi:MAG: hypothetical protein GWN81_22015, partial [Phycisphaerae bacterium]|nr:hypothetical protein [Phycisphaerae bacterium]